MSVPDLTTYIQGQTTLSADRLNTLVQSCDNVAQLRAFIGITGQQVACRGLSVPDDGGQGDFYWVASANSPDDGVNIIVPTGASGGAWIRLGLGALIVASALVTTNNTTIEAGVGYVPINNTTGSALAINLPSAPYEGAKVSIKDWAGNAASHTITVNGNGKNIDGASTSTLTTNYQAKTFIYSNGTWGVW